LQLTHRTFAAIVGLAALRLRRVRCVSGANSRNKGKGGHKEDSADAAAEQVNGTSVGYLVHAGDTYPVF